MLEELAVPDVDLIALEHGRHRNHQGELGQRAAVVVAHGEHGAVPVTHQRDLRGFVEQLRVRLPHVEAAERQRGCGVKEHEERQDQQRGDTTDDSGRHGDDSLG